MNIRRSVFVMIGRIAKTTHTFLRRVQTSGHALFCYAALNADIDARTSISPEHLLLPGVSSAMDDSNKMDPESTWPVWCSTIFHLSRNTYKILTAYGASPLRDGARERSSSRLFVPVLHFRLAGRRAVC